jgi:hypothetical protein
MSALLSASLVGVPMIAGCDRTISENQKTTTTPNGQQTTTQDRTVQHSDGSVTSEKNVNKTPNPNP